MTRVYINIGEYHQEWIRHIQPLVGLKPQTPIEVNVMQKHSVYWNATQERAANLAHYLIKAGQPMPLNNAPGGATYLQGERSDEEYRSLLEKGKMAFADNCARCHSSKLPEPVTNLGDGGDCNGAHYLACWEQFWQWTESDAFKSQMRDLVMADDFLENNYLSTDARIPVTVLGTEICSSMASNAIKGRVWDNFSSETYKSLPAMGDVELHDPVSDKTFTWNMPGGGRGYQRVPTLVSIWSTAPYLHNNEIGKFTNDPSTAGRMQAFDDGIRQLLWPATRRAGGKFVRVVENQVYGRPIGPVYLMVPLNALPSPLSSSWFQFLARMVGLRALFDNDGNLKIGPVPHGTPVALLSNINIDRGDPRFGLVSSLKLLYKLTNRLKRIERENLSPEAATAVLKEVVPDLIERSVCPDFEINRGHTFGSKLPDEDKEALIEFIKTL